MPAGFRARSLMVYRRGSIVHSSVQGFADLERRVPMKDDTIFRIYSMTKPITSVAFMMLVEQGLVALDEPVHKYIPEWKNLGVFQAGTAPAFMTRPPTRPMQIVDLLRHTSGLTYGFQQRTNVDAAYRDKQIGTLESAGTLNSMIAKPCRHSAGILAGRGLELLGLHGRDRLPRRQDQRHSLRAILKERIFNPLGMADTDFFVPADKAHRLAACYNATAGGMMSAHSPDAKGGLTLQDDPPRALFSRCPASSREAAACARRLPTTSLSAGRCSTAANSAASG